MYKYCTFYVVVSVNFIPGLFFLFFLKTIVWYSNKLRSIHPYIPHSIIGTPVIRYRYGVLPVITYRTLTEVCSQQDFSILSGQSVKRSNAAGRSKSTEVHTAGELEDCGAGEELSF